MSLSFLVSFVPCCSLARSSVWFVAMHRPHHHHRHHRLFSHTFFVLLIIQQSIPLYLSCRLRRARLSYRFLELSHFLLLLACVRVCETSISCPRCDYLCVCQSISESKCIVWSFIVCEVSMRASLSLTETRRESREHVTAYV